MSRGRRYDAEPKLNMKKVFAVIIAIVVIIMFIFIIKGLLIKDNDKGKITSESYFVSYKDNKWGVINETGSDIIAPSYKDMIVIPNSKVGVFICTYDIDYETGKYKTKALNEKNQEIFIGYDSVEVISNRDESNNLWYEQNVLKIGKDAKYGLVNLSGKNILPIEYEEIAAIPEIKNSFKVKRDGKYGIVDSDGKIVIEPQFADIDILGNDNKSGFIVKDESGKYGVRDYSNTQILELKYDSIEKVYGNDLYVVTLNGKQKIVNKDNSDVITSGFDSVKQILLGQNNQFIYVKNNKYGVMNLSGNVIIQAQYDSLQETKMGILMAKKGDKYGIINISNEQKVPFDYTSIVYDKKADIYMLEDANFNSIILDGNLDIKIKGMLIELNTDKGYLKLRVDNDYKYYNFKFEEKQEIDIFSNRTLFLSKKDGKFGYIDKNGKVIVDYIYDDAIEQNDYGYIAVKKDGKWGSIDNKGNIVQEPTYDLDDYLLVDFIGRWHLGLDINMNYYNQL